MQNTTDCPRKRHARTICLRFRSQDHYQAMLDDCQDARAFLHQMHQQHPEVFPAAFEEGFVFHGFVHSKKQNLSMRRLRLKATNAAYQIRPSFLMPYMIGCTEAVEPALFLRRWGEPFEALAHVFGRDAMYWYRAYLALGRPSLVGTSVKGAVPTDLVADEKHTRLGGRRVFLTTTVAGTCLLGANVVEAASREHLKRGYGVFAQEARACDPVYAPETVTTDGWEPTQQAWRGLFPSIAVILCFLHGVLAVKARLRRTGHLLHEVLERLWQVYQAGSLASFAQRVRRLREWTHLQEIGVPGKENLLSMCEKAAAFKGAYRHAGAYRTSNALERLMNYQDRLLYAMQYFHGTLASASQYARAMALLWNFHLYGGRTQRQKGRASPFEALNGFYYSDDWLENLLIAASLNGQRT